MRIHQSLNRPWPKCQGPIALIITLALAGSIAWAGKPPKPPPEPQPGYRMVTLGTGEARKINDAGWVAGGIAVLNGTWYAHRVFVLIPQDTNADGIPDTWYAGENGVNELVIVLDALGGNRDEAFDINDYLINDDGDIVDDHVRIVGFSEVSEPTPTSTRRAVLWQVNPETYEVEMTDLGLLLDHDSTTALVVNNRGQVLGYAGGLNSDTHYFLINPTDTDGDEIPDTWYADENSDGFNDLMINLGIVVSASLIDINDSGLIVGTSGDNGFLLRPKDVDGDGLLDWFADVNPTDGINTL